MKPNGMDMYRGLTVGALVAEASSDRIIYQRERKFCHQYQRVAWSPVRRLMELEGEEGVGILSCLVSVSLLLQPQSLSHLKTKKRHSRTDRCISATEATNTTFSSSIETEKWKNMYIKAITHGLVLLIVDLQKLYVWVHLRQLAYLHFQTRKHIRLLQWFWSQQTAKSTNLDIFFLLVGHTSPSFSAIPGQRLKAQDGGLCRHHNQGKRNPPPPNYQRHLRENLRGLEHSQPLSCWAEAPSPTIFELSQFQCSSADKNAMNLNNILIHQINFTKP
nr:uncharacterized protein LOC111255784 [Ipomoea batatas]